MPFHVTINGELTDVSQSIRPCAAGNQIYRAVRRLTVWLDGDVYALKV